MAIDVFNRDENDPLGIYSFDPAQATPAWVTDDWSQLATDQAQAKKLGATNPVRIATAITNDGTKYDVIVGADGKPISQIGDKRGVDDTVARLWRDKRAAAAAKSAPPGGKPYIDEEGPNGRRLGWDPNAYGPGQGGYTRDIGSSPSAQAAAAGASDTKPLEGYPGWNVRTTKVGTDTRTEFINPAGQVAQDPRPAAGAGSDTKPLEGYPGWNVRTTKVGTDTRTEFINPQGQAAADPRPAAERGARTPITRNGKTYIQVAGRNPDGTPTLHYEDQAGNRVTLPDEEKPGAYQPLPAGVPAFTPDFTQSDLGLGARRRQLDQLIADGTITKDQAASAIATDFGLADAAGKNAGAIVNIQEGNRRAALEARSQDVSDASSRRSFAGSTFNQALSSMLPIQTKFIDRPGAAEAAAGGFLAMLGMAREHAAATGAPNQAMPAFDPTGPYPFLGAMGQAGIPGLPGGPPLGPGWTFGQPPMPGIQPGPPRAADGTPYLRGPVNPVQSAMPGGWFTPTAPSPRLDPAAAAAVPGPPAIPMTPERVQGIMANPIFRPQPPVTLPGPAQAPGSVPPIGLAGPTPGMTLFRQQGLGQGYDPLGDRDLQDIWARSGLDLDVFPQAFGTPYG